MIVAAWGVRNVAVKSIRIEQKTRIIPLHWKRERQESKRKIETKRRTTYNRQFESPSLWLSWLFDDDFLWPRKRCHRVCFDVPSQILVIDSSRKRVQSSTSSRPTLLFNSRETNWKVRDHGRIKSSLESHLISNATFHRIVDGKSFSHTGRKRQIK